MIHTNNINPSRNQAGVSLMLAVLVLSAITAVVFSLATIVFIEIRSAGDAVKTEPTLYAAFAVTEEALFQYKRFVDDPAYDVTSCGNGGPAEQDREADRHICDINNVQLSLPGDQPIAFDDNPRVEFVAAGQIKTIPMYYANCFEQLYERVSLQVLPNPESHSLFFYFKATGSNGDVEEDPPSETPLEASVPPALPETYYGFDDRQFELILDNSDGPDLSVSIVAERTESAPCNLTPTGTGLPFVGEQVLRIRANYQNLNRTYQVRAPIP